MDNIDVRIITEVNVPSVVRLYQEAGWWKDEYTPAFIPEMVQRSCSFAGAFRQDELVGMGRAVSDGVSDAYIQDVTVLQALRGQGIGSRIIKALVADLQAKDVDWIGLIGEPGTQSFYERLGFDLLPGYLPMKLNVDNGQS